MILICNFLENENMNLRKANESDTHQISLIYKCIFDNSHLSSRYPLTLLNSYFKHLIAKNEFCYVAEEDDKITGFLIGGECIGPAIDDFKRSNYSQILIQLLKHPQFILKIIIKKLINSKLRSKSDLKLFIIGVDPEYGSKGIGSQLISKFEEDIKLKGYNQYSLNVRVNNLNAQKFYLNRGFEFEFKSNDSFSYIKKLS
jgi:ribosomal protein S18 acetylase RimI-like enzyme